MSDHEKIILEVIRELEDNAYGVPIREALKRKKFLAFTTFGELYRTLENLQAKGFVTSRQAGATIERGWRSKRFFKLTNAGMQAII